jgi:hypothetical protein
MTGVAGRARARPLLPWVLSKDEECLTILSQGFPLDSLRLRRGPRLQAPAVAATRLGTVSTASASVPCSW